MIQHHRYLFVTISLFAMLMLNIQCGKDVDPQALKYEFSEKLNLYPLKDSYSVNDTIWIEFSKTNKQLYDVKSNQLISLDTGSISFGMNIKPLYNAPNHPTDGYGDFVVPGVVTVDSFNHDYFGVFIGTKCSEPSFHFKIGYVPKYPGYYAIPIGGYSVTTCDSTATRKLWYAQINYRFDIADNGSAVYQQMPEAMRQQYRSTYLDGSQSQGVYYFKIE
jgi:hypothetical protein